MTALGPLLEDRVTQGTLDVPVFPEAARRVLETCEQQDCDARKVSGMVQGDPALAGHFLRIANSPAFAPRAPIVTLAQAIARLGLSQIRQIAILVAVRAKAFSSATRAADALALRRHAVVAALWAQEIARHRRMNVEEAFLGGLLQDVGTPALWQLAHDLGGGKGAADVDAEVHRLHARAGAAIVRAWKLPPRLGDAIERHHSPLSRGQASGSLDGTVAVVQLADVAARVTRQDRLVATMRNHPAVEALSLYANDLDELAARAETVVATASALA